MTLLTCSTDRAAHALCVLVCVWACSAQAHTLADTSVYPPVTSFDQAEAQLARYRTTGDDVLLQGVAAYFESSAASSPRARLLRAWHAQAAHHFAEASMLLAPILTGGNVNAWLLEANLQRIMGNHTASENACRQVSPIRPLLGQVCLLQTRVHRGQLPDPANLTALARIFHLLHTRTPIATEQQAWIMNVLSDAHAALGDLPTALAWSAEAFQANPTIAHRATYAARLLASGRPESALTLVDNRERAPALVVVRLLALKQLGRIDQATQTINTVDHQFRHDMARGDLLHAREMALFYLDILPDPERARWLVVENWKRQKELEDRTLLARARGFQ